MTLFRKLAVLAAIPAALAFQPATAGTLVTQWSYEVDNGFLNNFTQRACVGTLLNATQCASSSVTGTGSSDVGNHTRLAWGFPVDATGNIVNGAELALQSAIEVTTEINGNDLVTNGGPELGGKFTHKNFRIVRGGHTLETASLRSRLILDPFLPDVLDTNETLTADFDITFRETTNFATCPAGDPFPGTPCSDIFVISPEDIGQLVRNFVFDGYKYTVVFIIPTLEVLTDAQCTAAGAASGCRGFLTEENKITELQTSFLIRAEPITIPEPTTLALLGLSVFGLGAAGKLRKRA